MTREFLEGLGLDGETVEAVLQESSGELSRAREEITRLKGLLQEEKAKNTEMQRDSQVDQAVRDSGARNLKAVKALLDLAAAADSEDFSLSLEEQLKKLKEENDFLFSGADTPRVIGKSGKAKGSDFKFKFTGVR